MADWNIDSIAAALGGETSTPKPGVTVIRLTHEDLGIRLKLELAPDYEAIRLWCGRQVNGERLVLGRTDVFGITDVLIDEGMGEVRFRTAEPNPSEVTVTDAATFLVTVGAYGSTDPEPSAREVAAVNCSQASPTPPRPRDGDGLLHMVGRLARPHYSDRTGKPFFTAGLAEYPNQAVAPIWHNLKAFGGVATQAAELERGQFVRLSGKLQEDCYQNKAGVEVTKPVILLVHIEASAKS